MAGLVPDISIRRPGASLSGITGPSPGMTDASDASFRLLRMRRGEAVCHPDGGQRNAGERMTTGALDFAKSIGVSTAIIDGGH
jgi:hypothetical protein